MAKAELESNPLRVIEERVNGVAGFMLEHGLRAEHFFGIEAEDTHDGPGAYEGIAISSSGEKVGVVTAYSNRVEAWSQELADVGKTAIQDQVISPLVEAAELTDVVRIDFQDPRFRVLPGFAESPSVFVA